MNRLDTALAGDHHKPFQLLMTWLMAAAVVAFLLGAATEQVFTTLVFIHVGLYIAISAMKFFGKKR